MSDSETSGKKEKTPVARKKTVSKRGKKKTEDDGKPKRPLSAYNLFFRDERVKWNEEQEAEGHQLHAKERFLALGKAMSSRWMQLSEDKKKVYKDEAEAAMEKYREEMAVWQSVQKEKLKEAKLKKPAVQPEPETMNVNQRPQVNSNPVAIQQALNQQGLASQLGGMLNQNSLAMQQPGMAQLLGAGGLDPQMQQLLMNNQAMLGGMGMGMGGLGGLGGMGGLQGANMGGFGLGGGNMAFAGGNGMGMFQNDQLAQLQLRQQQLQQQQLQQQQLQQQQLQQQQLQQQQHQHQQQFGGMQQHQLGLQPQQQQQFVGLHQGGLSPQLGSMGSGDAQQQQLVQEYLRQQQLQQQQGM